MQEKLKKYDVSMAKVCFTYKLTAFAETFIVKNLFYQLVVLKFNLQQ